MHNFLQDVRLGVRMLRKHWGVSLIAVAPISRGIALTTMLFSFVHGALLKGLPVPEPDRLVLLESTDPVRTAE
ncbi:MAG: hypothetical protein PVF27_04395 [Gemmatimonadales bacterium]